MAKRIQSIVVKNVSAVQRPANGRRFLIVKAEGGPNMLKKSAVDEVEERVAAHLHTHPVTANRTAAIAAVFAADPELYERYRAETTVGRDGQILDRRPSLHNVGIGKAETEVLRRADEVVSKRAGLSTEAATDVVFRNDPALEARWRQESYA